MKLVAGLTEEEMKEVIKAFSEELIAMGEYYRDEPFNFLKDYLEDDLERFPKMIREEMLRRKAKVE